MTLTWNVSATASTFSRDTNSINGGPSCCISGFCQKIIRKKDGYKKGEQIGANGISSHNIRVAFSDFDKFLKFFIDDGIGKRFKGGRHWSCLLLISKGLWRGEGVLYDVICIKVGGRRAGILRSM